MEIVKPLETGLKTGNLTIIKLAYTKPFYYKNRKINKQFYLCKCDCGRETIVYRHNLTRNINKTTHCCHCRNAKHNMRNTRLFRIWAGIRKRVYNKNSIDYKNYGGRGITIYKEWSEFLPFYKWAINNGYKDNLTIDRKNNNGNYEPENCRWVSRKEQNKNKRNNIHVFYKNKNYNLEDLAKLLNIKYKTLYKRIRRYGICDKVFSQKSIKTGKILC